MIYRILLFLLACPIFVLSHDSLVNPTSSFNRVYQRASPAVVSIHTSKQRRVYGMYNRVSMKAGLGSGVLMSDDGYILSNDHVVSGKDTIKVHLMDGRIYDAEIVGVDQRTDLALLKIEGINFPVVTMGNSDELKVGDWAIAIGNPFGFSGSLTVGVISAKGRSDSNMERFSDLIQTDVAINPGNSGGALLNTDGALIGINSSVFSKTGEYIGISFSIPVNMARRVMADLKQYGHVRRGWLGVGIRPLTKMIRNRLNLKSRHGAYVGELSEKSHAFKAGLRENDVILKVNNKHIIDYQELLYRVAELVIGDQIKLTCFRGGELIDIDFELEEPPSSLN
jgi:S1-C subfamily serine protease